MTTALTIHQHGVHDLEVIARALATSKLFGVQTPEQALALCLLAQAEGRHPATAALDYDIIQGKPAKKSKAMLRDFLAAGGAVEWHKLDDTCADATFSHAQGGTVRINWDMARAQMAGLVAKDMWKKFPRQMLKARVVSEGVGTVFPMATSGMYEPGEVADFEPDQPRNVTPKRAAPLATTKALATAVEAPIEGDPFAQEAPATQHPSDYADELEYVIDTATDLATFGPHLNAAIKTAEWKAFVAEDPERAASIKAKGVAKVAELKSAVAA